MTTFPDKVFELGGKPVSGGYGAMWSGKTFYVDYDNGTAGASGTSIKSPQKYLANAISSASAWDVIYIRPRTPYTAAGSPYAHLPESTTNWTIPYTKHGMSLIGTNVGLGIGGQYGTLLQGTETAGATPALYIKAPFVSVENLAFHRGGSTLGTTGTAVKASYTDDGADQAFQLSFSNCTFVDNDFGVGGKSYGLVLDSVWFSTIFNSTFIDLGWAISLPAGNSVTQGDQIIGCKFQGLTASILCDIYSSGAVANILITDCHFNHVLPTGGSPNKYIVFSAASTGMVSNSYCAAASVTTGTNTTLNGVLASHFWTEEGDMAD